MDPITELIAKQACAELITRYAIAVNDWNLDAFVDLFHEDAEWHRPGDHIMRGREEMRAYLLSQPQPPAERTLRHVNGGILIEVTDDNNATAWSQTTVYDTGPSATLPAAMVGPDMVVEYCDRLVRRDGRWRLMLRSTTQVFKA